MALEAGKGTTPPGAATEEQAAKYVRGMFGQVAHRYDLLNHLLSFQIDKYWRRRTVKRVQAILDRPEAVGYGMNAASYLAERLGLLAAADAAEMRRVTNLYGPWPNVSDLKPETLAAHTLKDKKTIQGTTHFVLAEGIGKVRVVSGIPAADVVAAAAAAL